MSGSGASKRRGIGAGPIHLLHGSRTTAAAHHEDDHATSALTIACQLRTVQPSLEELNRSSADVRPGPPLAIGALVWQ